MKRILIAITAASLLFTLPAQADWAPTDSTEPGFHELVIQDKVDFFKQFSYLNAYVKDQEYVCANMSKGNCKTLKAANFNVIFPACQSSKQFDCIAGLKISGATSSENAKFSRYTMPGHPSLFKGDGKRLMSNPQSPSVWRAATISHGSGQDFIVHVGMQGGINNGVVTDSNFYAQIYAIEELAGRGEEFDQNNFANFPWCNFDSKTRALIGCGSGGGIDGEVCVAQFIAGGNCAAKRVIPEDVSFTLQIRLSKEPNGWYHGRLSEPSISIGKSGSGVLVSIHGGSVGVPILNHWGQYPDFPQALKNFWDKCAASWDCPKSTREFGADLANQDGSKRNLTSEQQAWSPNTLATVKLFKNYIRDASPKLDQVWAVRSLEVKASSGNKCFTSKGFKGMVTTNSTAYTDGPPTLVKGVLKYSVSSPKYLVDEQQEIDGSYNLIMRTSLAKCVYGSSKISPRAEISVRSLKGDVKVATSIKSRNNSWIRLSAQNFAY